MSSQLKDAIAAIRQGNWETAAQLLAQLLLVDRDNEEAWLWMTEDVDDLQRQKHCLQHVLRVNPDNRLARLKLASLASLESDSEHRETRTSMSTSPNPSQNGVLVANGRDPTLGRNYRWKPMMKSETGLLSAWFFLTIGSLSMSRF